MKILKQKTIPNTQRYRITHLLPIIISIFVFTSLFMVGCKPSARPDDNLEPNDDFEHATVIAEGQVIKARANQWNTDVFSFTLGEKGAFVFLLESLGLEDCAAFTVNGPDGTILYQDAGDFCSSGYREIPAVQAEGVTFNKIEGFGYKITVTANTMGTYFLSIYERSAADNVLPFSWDYCLTATTGYVGENPVSMNIITWDVYKGNKKVLIVSNQPGPITSTAMLPPGTKPVMHPFLSAQALDSSEEDKLGSILRKSKSFDEFISLLKANGYKLKEAQ